MALARIVEPRVRWADEFAEIAARLKVELGGLALRIEHIGSTSVPGLAAKDVIDAQVSVAELDQATLGPAINRAGFEGPRLGLHSDHMPAGFHGEQDQWQKLYFASRLGERKVHVHVRRAGNANERYALLFRDYLRAHPAAAAAYAELKRRLAALDIETGVYADIKDPACDLIAIAADVWAAQTGWRLPP